MIKLDHKLTPTDLLPQARAVLGAVGRVHRGDRAELPARLGVAGVHGRRAATRPRAGPSGRRAFSTARRCCSSTRRATSGSWSSAASGRSHVMAPHLTHVGVHDHGFNNVSTYGNLWRLMNEGRIAEHEWERRFYELALKASGAVQAARWSKTRDGTGYIYSFNGPQSLFVDTIRSCRSLALAHQLGHALMGERDERDQPAAAARRARRRTRPATTSGTAKAATRTTSPAARPTKASSTPTTATIAAPRRSKAIRRSAPGPAAWPGRCSASPNSSNGSRRAAMTSSTTVGGRDGDRSDVPEGGPRDLRLLHPRNADRAASPTGTPARPASPSSATISIAPPIRSTTTSRSTARPPRSPRKACCGWATISSTSRARSKRAAATSKPASPSSSTLLDEPYLSTDPEHEGLILHSVYHRPNGWDYIPPGRKVPCGESSMWGDYHAREVGAVRRTAGRERRRITRSSGRSAER